MFNGRFYRLLVKIYEALLKIADNLPFTKASGTDINTGTDDEKFVTSKAVADSKLADFIRGDGWLTVSETWTRKSATEIYASGNVTGKYQKGDKIKYTQPTDGLKYMYIISVSSYDSVNNRTTLTVTAGTSYDLDSEAIISPYFSKQENPQGFPEYFTFTPTNWSGVDDGAGNDPTGFTALFYIRRNVAHYSIFKSGGWYKAGTGQSFSFSGGLPTGLESYMGLGFFSLEWGTSSIKRLGHIFTSGSIYGVQFIFNSDESDNVQFYGGGKWETRI